MRADQIIAEEFKFDKNNRDMSLFGAFSSSDQVSFVLKFNEIEPESVKMIVHKDAWNSGVTAYHVIELEKMSASTEYSSYKANIDISEFVKLWDGREGLFYYHYLVKFDGRDYAFGGEKPTVLNLTGENIGERQLLVYKDSYKTSESYRDGVIYHIFVDRFKRSGRCEVKKGAELNEDWDNGIPQFGEYPGAEVSNNVFFGGDLYGIAEKLDYISSLGVKTIYLSPVFEAYSNHKYDTGDYLTVDSMFGGDEALTELCKKAKKYGINIILDGVFNHTGSDSIYFNKNGTYPTVGAYQSEESPYFDWYSFKEFPDDYECWWGVKILPRVDSSNEEFRGFICGDVLNKWMDNGVSGWRLDVADELDEGFLEDFRAAVKKYNPDGVVIGEVWEDASDKVSYGKRRHYLCGSQLDSVMNYPLRSALIEYVKFGRTEQLRRYTEGSYRRYPKCSSDNLMNFLGTHDTERILTLLGGEETGDKTNAELSRTKMSADQLKKGKTLLKSAYGILAGLPGSPCIFYGDEAGLEGYRDPFCRSPFPWNNIDSSLLEYYRTIGMIRRENTVFRDGVFKIILLDERVFMYERAPFEGKEEYKIIVCAAREGNYQIRLSDSSAELISKTEKSVFDLAPHEVIYIKCSLDTVLDSIEEKI